MMSSTELTLPQTVDRQTEIARILSRAFLRLRQRGWPCDGLPG